MSRITSANLMVIKFIHNYYSLSSIGCLCSLKNIFYLDAVIISIFLFSCLFTVIFDSCILNRLCLGYQSIVSVLFYDPLVRMSLVMGIHLLTSTRALVCYLLICQNRKVRTHNFFFIEFWSECPASLAKQKCMF